MSGKYFMASRQARLIRQSIDLTRSEILSTYRPKICIKHVWPTTDIWKGEHITVNLVCVNNSTTEVTLNEASIQICCS